MLERLNLAVYALPFSVSVNSLQYFGFFLRVFDIITVFCFHLLVVDLERPPYRGLVVEQSLLGEGCQVLPKGCDLMAGGNRT